MKCKATQRGFDGTSVKEVGEVFTLPEGTQYRKKEDGSSATWFEVLDADVSDVEAKKKPGK